ncbi:MAG TPA: hypothetical protein VGM41_13645 [Chitinophagaceae bacterium]
MKPSTRLHSPEIYIAVFIIAFFTTGCHYLHHQEKQDIQYIPLSDYKYTPAKVDAGTAMRVIAYSGGKDSDKDNIYYCQFITINSLNGDTVRVLASLISFDSPDNGEVHTVHTTSAIYDGRKEITDAVFVPEDSTSTLILNTPVDLENDKKDLHNFNPDDLYKIKRPQLVAINKSLPMLQTPSYKTIVGVLHFKDQPW